MGTHVNQNTKAYLLKQKLETSSFLCVVCVCQLLIAMDIMVYTTSPWGAAG